MSEKIFLGIDVSKRHLVVDLTTNKKSKTFTNNAKGIQQAVDYLSGFQIGVAILEATGGLPRWWVLRLTRATAVTTKANAVAGVAGRWCTLRCIWRRSR